MIVSDLEQARFNMIEQQIRPWDVLDQRVLDTLSGVPREKFVPERYQRLAFADVRIPIGHGQVMMNPNVEGRLLQALTVHPTDTVLEVGTGSGFVTACLGRLAAAVDSVELIEAFIDPARRRLRQLGIDNVRLHQGDAAVGWGERRYDAIALTGALPVLDDRWLQQLSVGGRLFAIIGSLPIMEAVRITRVDNREWEQESLFETELPYLLNSERPAAFRF